MQLHHFTASIWAQEPEDKREKLRHAVDDLALHLRDHGIERLVDNGECVPLHLAEERCISEIVLVDQPGNKLHGLVVFVVATGIVHQCIESITERRRRGIVHRKECKVEDGAREVWSTPKTCSCHECEHAPACALQGLCVMRVLCMALWVQLT